MTYTQSFEEHTIPNFIDIAEIEEVKNGTLTREQIIRLSKMLCPQCEGYLIVSHNRQTIDILRCNTCHKFAYKDEVDLIVSRAELELYHIPDYDENIRALNNL